MVVLACKPRMWISCRTCLFSLLGPDPRGSELWVWGRAELSMSHKFRPCWYWLRARVWITIATAELLPTEVKVTRSITQVCYYNLSPELQLLHPDSWVDMETVAVCEHMEVLVLDDFYDRGGPLFHLGFCNSRSVFESYPVTISSEKSQDDAYLPLPTQPPSCLPGLSIFFSLS